jgi:hypothetical protein
MTSPNKQNLLDDLLLSDEKFEFQEIIKRIQLLNPTEVYLFDEIHPIVKNSKTEPLKHWFSLDKNSIFKYTGIESSNFHYILKKVKKYLKPEEEYVSSTSTIISIEYNAFKKLLGMIKTSISSQILNLIHKSEFAIEFTHEYELLYQIKELKKSQSRLIEQDSIIVCQSETLKHQMTKLDQQLVSADKQNSNFNEQIMTLKQQNLNQVSDIEKYKLQIEEFLQLITTLRAKIDELNTKTNKNKFFQFLKYILTTLLLSNRKRPE